MIRDLARKFSAFDRFVDNVIIELTFRRGTFEAGAEIVKAHSAMTLLRASTADAEILLKMIRPRRQVTAVLGCRIQSAEKTWRVFTASEILNFVESVGDCNEIHRLNPPIVPALLILETLLSDEKFSSVDGLKLKFKNFVTAGEPLSLVGEKNFELTSAGVRKVSGEILS